jgi:catechol 2,3-dioxygenase-like lactoylglutathione lyase family enzyme
VTEGVIVRLHHVAVITTDLESSIDWYRRHLGFRLVDRGKHAGARLAFLRAPRGGLLELAEEGTGCGEGAVSHLALAVRSVARTTARLREAGVAVLEGPALIYTGGQSAFIHGPSGELIELIGPPLPKSR